MKAAGRNIDPVPFESEFSFSQAADTGMCTASFFAFNTTVTLQAFPGKKGPAGLRKAFLEARDACRHYERLFSRTLPHSDISQLNTAHREWVNIHPDTYELLCASLRYCEQSGGVFDITMGPVTRLWDFREGVLPAREDVEAALQHVSWRDIELFATSENAGDTFRARLADSRASVDVGGTAKGFIADALCELLESHGVASFALNLGGNVAVRGRKPDGSPWRVGVQNPHFKRTASTASQNVLGTINLLDASAVTSGTYERSFKRNGVLYHHILSTETGYPVETDLAGATVIARKSMDAEGYSTTLLALGKHDAAEFVRAHPAILCAYLVDTEGEVACAAQETSFCSDN